MIHNLPTDQSPELLQKRITSALKEIFNKNNESPFIKVRVLGDYDELYNLCVKLKRNIV
jgi:hypothetical protein